MKNIKKQNHSYGNSAIVGLLFLLCSLYWSSTVNATSSIESEVCTPTIQLSINSPVDGAQTDAHRITVEGSAPVGSYVAIVNNQHVSQKLGPIKSGTFSVRVPLDQGPNQLIAHDWFCGTTFSSQPVYITRFAANPGRLVLWPFIVGAVLILLLWRWLHRRARRAHLAASKHRRHKPVAKKRTGTKKRSNK